MLDRIMKLAVVLSAVDHLTGPLKKGMRGIEELERAAGKTAKLRSLGEDMQSFGQRAMIAGVVAGAALAVPIRAYAQLENAATRAQVAFLTKGGTDPAFAKVEKVAVRLGNLLPGNTADFMEMSAAMREVGISAQAIAAGGLEATGFLKTLLGNISPEEAGRMMGTFALSLGVAEKDFVSLVDVMQKGRFGFGLDLTDFADTAKYVAPIAKQLGIVGLDGARSMVAFAGAMSQAGIRGSKLGTSLRATLLELPMLDTKIKKNAEVASALARAGITLRFFDSKGQFLGFENFIAQLGQLNRLASQQRLSVISELFGQESASALALVAERGLAGYRESLGVMEQQASLQERLSLIMGTTSNKIEAATGTLSNLLAAIGKSVGPVLKIFADAANTVFGWLTAFVEQHQRLTGVVVALVGAFAIVAFVLGAVAVALGTFIVWMVAARSAGLLWNTALALSRANLLFLVGGLARATAATWTFTAALLANPIGATIAVVVALAIAAFLLVRNWSSVSAFFGRAWTGIRGAFAGGMAWLRSIDLSDAGARIIRSIWFGMQSMATKPIALMQWMAGKLRAFLPFSPAKEGPLRDLHRVRIVETIASTIRPAPLVTALRTAAAMALAAVSVEAPVLVGGVAQAVPTSPARAVARAIAATNIPRLPTAATDTIRAASVPASVAARNRELAQSAPRGRQVATAAAPIQFTYAPVIHLPPGTPSENVAAVRRALEEDKGEFQRRVEEAVDAKLRRDQRKTTSVG